MPFTGPDQLYVYDGVPPTGFKLIDPVESPKQLTSIWFSLRDNGALGWLTFKVETSWQLFVSVTVTE